jgi:hypothetical protein
MAWRPSIKDDSPEHPDSLIKKIRGMRVDVSKMNSKQLEQHMDSESVVRRKLSRSKKLPDILPEVDKDEEQLRGVTAIPPVQRDALPKGPAGTL